MASLTILNPPPPPAGAGLVGGGPAASEVSAGALLPVSGGGRSRIPVGPGTPLYPERRAHYTRDPALVVAGLAVKMPRFAGVSTSSGAITTPDPSAEIADALSVNLGADFRWLPGATYHAAGAGTVWTPSVGAGRDWSGTDTDSAPYLDPAFEVPNRREPDDVRPALIFDGGRYLKLPTHHASLFTMAMVVRLIHPPASGYSDILSSPSSATDATRGLDLDLRYRSGALRAHTESVAYCDIDLLLRSISSTYHNGNELRPAIIVWAQGTGYFRLGLITARQRLVRQRKLVHRPPPAGYDLSFYLGRNGASYDILSTAHMQVLEMAMWDSALGLPGIRNVLRKLNGIYKVR